MQISQQGRYCHIIHQRVRVCLVGVGVGARSDVLHSFVQKYLASFVKSFASFRGSHAFNEQITDC